MNKLSEIEKIMYHADHMHLIKIGAPTDEYDHISRLIYQTVYSTDPVQIVQRKIWNIFYCKFCIFDSYQLTEESSMQRIGTYRQPIDEAIKSIGTVESFEEIAIQVLSIMSNDEIISAPLDN